MTTPKRQEIEELENKYGAFERATFEYKTISAPFAEWLKRLKRRRGEIVLVVPRGGSSILLHTKPHYPAQTYRLPTGGIHPGEAAPDAAKREGFEEIGFKPKGLSLLAVLDNVFWIDNEPFVYPSFVFRTQEFVGKPNPTDPDEPISGFMDATPSGLLKVARQLATLTGGWHDWGIFRAAPHAWLSNYLRHP